MSKRDEKRKSTPINVARHFASGNWVNMCAEYFDVSEARIEIQLMEIAQRYCKAHSIKVKRRGK